MDARQCPGCGAVMTADDPEGLCPGCLMRRGLLPSSGVRGTGEGTTGPPGGGAVPPPAELALLFPQLEVVELLGRGGMGAVYKARQPGLDRLVALKVLTPEAGRATAFAERFSREARALARLNHPHIVGVYEFGQTGGLYYFLMEYVDGVNLRQALRAGQLRPEEALKIVPQLCDALQYAHEEGVVHRDIKPENILLDRKGRVKVADFGLAKLLDRGPAGHRLTAEYQAMGTPHYMAPEQLERPLEVDHRADIYSLGVTFYEMLTGELPLGRFAPPSQKVQVDVRLDEVVLRTLEKEPARRYQHAGDVKTDLEAIRGRARPATGSLICSAIRDLPPSVRRDLWQRLARAVLSLLLAFALATVIFLAIPQHYLRTSVASFSPNSGAYSSLTLTGTFHETEVFGRTRRERPEALTVGLELTSNDGSRHALSVTLPGLQASYSSRTGLVPGRHPVLDPEDLLTWLTREVRPDPDGPRARDEALELYAFLKGYEGQTPDDFASLQQAARARLGQYRSLGSYDLLHLTPAAETLREAFQVVAALLALGFVVAVVRIRNWAVERGRALRAAGAAVERESSAPHPAGAVPGTH